jgi:hypothetical protein
LDGREETTVPDPDPCQCWTGRATWVNDILTEAEAGRIRQPWYRRIDAALAPLSQTDSNRRNAASLVYVFVAMDLRNCQPPLDPILALNPRAVLKRVSRNQVHREDSEGSLYFRGSWWWHRCGEPHPPLPSSRNNQKMRNRVLFPRASVIVYQWGD